MGMLEKVAPGLQPALMGTGVNQISSAKVSPDTFIKTLLFCHLGVDMVT